jgi:hypothetical protein
MRPIVTQIDDRTSARSFAAVPVAFTVIWTS